MEEWRDIQGYEGKYQVSNKGRVKALSWRKCGTGNNQKEHILKESETRGYKRVTLSKDGVMKTFSVHKLVAEAFIPNLENKPQIDHINTIRNDNRVENLKWVSAKENNLNPITLSKHCEILKNREDQSKKVGQFKNGTLVKTYDSVSETGRCGFSFGCVSRCCRGERKTHKGYEWKFIIEEKSKEITC